LQSFDAPEDGAKELRLDSEKDEEAFHTILAYMYTGKASVATERVLNVRAVITPMQCSASVGVLVFGALI
jgi:hypothetical protein